MAKRRGRIQRDMMIDRTKRNHAGAAALAVSFVLLMVLVSAAIGRYQHRLDSEGWVRAMEFYFTSDFLDGNAHTLAPVAPGGSAEMRFTVGNHADELRFSEMDIAYQVTVTPADGGSATVEGGSGTLSHDGVHDADVTLRLTPGTYTVAATGTGKGYAKTLSATIEVPTQSAGLYWHKESVPGEYTLLTVWNEGDQGGDVTISYSGIPDNTNPNMTDWATNGRHTVTLGAHESKVFRFFSGTVTVSGAAPKTPV